MTGVPAVDVRAVTVVDDALRAELLACWVDVSNAGGAVGFVPPVDAEDVAPVLDRLLEGVASGRAVLCVLTVDGATAGFAALVGSSSPLRRHWGTVLRVQVHPSRQGTGLGRALMEGVHRIAADRGLGVRVAHRPRRHGRRRVLPRAGLHRGGPAAGGDPRRRRRRPGRDPAGPEALMPRTSGRALLW